MFQSPKRASKVAQIGALKFTKIFKNIFFFQSPMRASKVAQIGALKLTKIFKKDIFFFRVQRELARSLKLVLENVI